MRAIAAHLDREGPSNPFPGLAALERRLGRKLPHQLGSNEGLDMPHVALTKAMGAEVARLARRYGDAQAFELRRRLSARLEVPIEALLVDAGADSLIALALRTLCEPGSVAVAAAGTYPTFSYFAQSTGCRLIEPSYREAKGVLAPDLDALIEAAHQRHARLVYLANPDNPSGHLFDDAEIERLRDQLPGDCSLLLDEAYHDFRADAAGSAPLEGVIRLRTFSKAHGLAGLRIGFAIAEPALVEAMLKARIHYAVASLSLAAAELVLDHDDEVREHIEAVTERRERLTAMLREAGLDVLPSATNFIAVRLADAQSAEAVQRALLERDVVVHRPPHPALGHVLRISTVEDALVPGRLAPLLEAVSRG
ncbi:pyridoxal phosphate-dependent aminotransferase [Halotalea alkalilenta]|uniref:histidinol-phosphate transaminase n=1 Tax=Halotalea alkalilenta TaxID=376489 RepID=A0A172YBV1_9GAMM|nr:aminotransferase class I/II-fold pyridoxal phosphate-dependent enzyme [Halotalea alkalilenta]ANF56707.1 aminotransferase [Halotalea alkalilenta]